ncbi:baseplate J/gp47 family protein [Bradyrhizobium japonicum]|uniref:baseplate J/gp47 family protein n=1 Tax=Bradyrhizobium japonicum TaxID=375 RepID=UPI001BAAA6EB|nr:baseplate J/gp47 family protein [Bradyrhizobium japonicum]MBR0748767.1 baseplate J/gp47 family protein [Bradyrhizobium japonicum]
MPLPSPKLDDRRFEDLLREAQALIRTRCPNWTDFSPSDPGMTLVEVFAFLTDTMLYRLNRLPEKIYVALLKLLGVSQLPPAAARVVLTFTRAGEEVDILVPAGTRVSDASGMVVFATVEEAMLTKETASIEITAIHGEQVEAELVGTGTAAPAQSYRVRHGPILRDLGEKIWTVMVGVEAIESEMSGKSIVRVHDGKVYVMWREVLSFVGLEPTDRAYVLDRADGLITFAPSRGVGETGGPTLATVPPRNREIRVWYRRGGGRQGNVAADLLTVFRDPIPGLRVTNPMRASGGEDSESVDQALVRGRDAVRVLSSAVTAADFESVALQCGGIARARAYAQRDVWSFGEPGVVEVRIVPKINSSTTKDGAVTPEILAAHQTSELADRVDEMLTHRRPLGVKTRVHWAGCRPVAISVRVVVSRTENLEQLRTRLITRLNALIAPDGTWLFGRALRASDVYEAIVAEPGVRYAEQLQFSITDAPQEGTVDVVRDRRQARTYFAASNGGLFRSLDNGRSWTKSLSSMNGRAILTRCHQDVPGLVVSIVGSEDIWPVHVSLDGGENWTLLEQIQGEQVYDAAWLQLRERPILLMATRKGLRSYELGSETGSTTIDQMVSDSDERHDGYYAVAASRHALGVSMVAVAAREKRGVFLSREGGAPGSFHVVPGAEGRDIRVLRFQIVGGRTYLWAGIAAEAGSEGEGAMCTEARAAGIDAGGWSMMSKDWKGGSCESIDFLGQTVVAGSNRGGVLVLESGITAPSWSAPALDCGLPINAKRNALVTVDSVAIGPPDGILEGSLIMAGTPSGTFLSADGGKHFFEAGRTMFPDHAPLPANWLYCSGTHDLKVVYEDQDFGS